MLKTLIKKQLRELAAALTRGPKGRRSRGMLVLLIVLLVYAFGVGGALFYVVADALCLPLAQEGLGWLYFALMGTMATALGVAGSVFTAHSALYQAKDNELLLAMPVPPAYILLVRVAGVYLLSFLFEAVAFVPAVWVYGWQMQPGAAAVVFGAALLFLLPLLAVALSCVLGWLIGLVLARMSKSAQNLAYVALSLGFVAAYYFLYSRAYAALQQILLDSAALSGQVKLLLYPMYRMGRAATGDPVSFVLFTAMVLAVFGIVYAVLSHSFLDIATRRPGAAKAVYKERAVRPGTPRQALLRKEWKRFLGMPVYLLNCGLGALLLAVGAVLAAGRGAELRVMLELLPPELEAVVPLLVCAAVALAASTSIISAPSISLESRTLWLLQSLPVTAWQVLRSKLELHITATALPAAACALALGWALRLGWGTTALIAVCGVLYVVLCAALGLCINLKLPNLDWTSETAAVKQSPSVLAAMLIGWVPALVLGALYFVVGRWLTAGCYLLVCAALLCAAAGVCLAWLCRKGAELFADL